ncbi:MAG: TonB-dependent receptor [Bacteroidales bacterium]
MKKWVLFVVMMGFFTSLFSQRPDGPGRGNSNMPAEGLVTGIVLEKGTDMPMEYANFVLYAMRDSSLVTGTVTNADGSFKLTEIRYGRFYAIVNFIGYNKTIIPDIKINPQQKEINLGSIYLESASTNLEGVEIIADKAHVEYKIDKKIVNPSQDIMALGGSAASVLENTPSVQVDIEGNVSLRGTSNFTVLIDGRPSVLEGSDALQQIPASTIEQIEIITNPSAKYDPDGIGGIINVVLKKQKQPGINGIVNGSIGSGNKYKLDALINYRKEKFNAFGGFDINYREFRMEGHTEYETFLTDTISYRNSDRIGKMNRNGFGLKGGVDYFISNKSTISFSGQYGGYGFGRDFESKSTLWSNPVTSTDYTLSQSESNRDGQYYNFNLDYIAKFEKPGHQLDIMAYYANRTGDDKEGEIDYITNQDWNSIESDPESIRTTEDENSDEFRLKADYTNPIGKEGHLEAGYQSRLDYENEKYTFEDFDYTVNDWVENDEYTSEVDFKRNIHALYTTFSNTSGSWGYQAGFRGEYTDREIKNVKSEDGYVINRMDYFPSIHLSRKFEGNHQVLASYSRRIERPGGRELDPFVNYIDEYNIRQGNPTLEPEYIDSYELAYQKRMDKSFVSFETYYRINKNKITRIRTLLDDGIMLHTYQNLNKDYSLGIELMLNADITKWLLLNASINVFDYRLEGSIEEEDVSAQSLNWDSRLNATVKFKQNFRFQFTGFYHGPTVTAQGEREGYYMANAALRKDFFNKKFSATLSAQDMFATAKREMTTSGSGFSSYDNYRREAPIVSLNLSYIINNYKNQKNGERNGEDSDGGGDIEM